MPGKEIKRGEEKESIMIVDKVLKREDVPQKSKWHKEAVFASWDKWEAEAGALTTELTQLQAFDGKLKQGPDMLADWLELVTGLGHRLFRLLVYTYMATSVDAGDMIAKEHMDQLLGLYTKFNTAVAFSKPAMLEMGNTLLLWAKDEPRLNPYEHFFHDLLRQKVHHRSTEVEEILSMVQEPFSNTGQTASELTDLDMKFPDALDSKDQSHPVRQAVVPPTGIQNPDRKLRRNAWENYYDGYLSFKNTLASNYITSVKQNVFMARVRGYNSVLEAQLAPTNLPIEVFHNLIDTFKANLTIWHRYWEVRRKMLGVEQLHPYDIWAPLVDNQPVIPYSEGVKMICEGMAPLGEEYVAVVRRGCLEDGWVDYAPNVSKLQGAASSPSYDSPPFIFTSYHDTLLDVSTLAHELGHSMHGYLADIHQPHIYNIFNCYGQISMAVAETASNFNQALVRDHLIQAKADDPIFQLTLIEEAMSNFHRYFFIMPTLARFELEVHTRAEQGQPLTAVILNNHMADLFAEGYGDTMTDDRERTAITWAQFRHLYVPFYTFQYSIGISAAHALADKILAGEPGAVDNYLNFLKAGSSLYPMDLFKMAGVDMTKPVVVEKTFGVLNDLVDRFDSLASSV